MNKTEHDALKTLVLEVFEKAAKNMETYIQSYGIDAEAECLWDDVLQEYPILSHKDDAALNDALVDLMISQKLLPVGEGETEDFFLQILNGLETGNKSHARHNAGLALSVLSQGRELIRIPELLKN